LSAFECATAALVLPPPALSLRSYFQEEDKGAEAEWHIEMDRRVRKLEFGKGKVELVPWSEARRCLSGRRPCLLQRLAGDSESHRATVFARIGAANQGAVVGMDHDPLTAAEVGFARDLMSVLSQCAAHACADSLFQGHLQSVEVIYSRGFESLLEGHAEVYDVGQNLNLPLGMERLATDCFFTSISQGSEHTRRSRCRFGPRER
jgi:hypothetical protein